jgi:hypothetical protein
MCAINMAHQTYISKLTSNMSNLVDGKFKKCKIVVWKAQKDTIIIIIIIIIVVYHSLPFVIILPI